MAFDHDLDVRRQHHQHLVVQGWCSKEQVDALLKSSGKEVHNAAVSLVREKFEERGYVAMKRAALGGHAYVSDEEWEGFWNMFLGDLE